MYVLCKFCVLSVYFVITSLPGGTWTNHIRWPYARRPILPARREGDDMPEPPPPPRANAIVTRDPQKNELTTREHLQRDYKVENCDNIAFYCFKAYDTGRLCARNHVQMNNMANYTPRYQTMQNYCQMDFINCCEGFDVWEISHLGACLIDKPYIWNTIGEYYEYHDDVFLDNVYVIRE